MQSWVLPDIHTGSNASAEPRANKFAKLSFWLQYIPGSLRLSQISTQGLTLLLSLQPICLHPCLGLVIILSQDLLLATIHTMQSWAQPDIHPGSHTSAEPQARPSWYQWGIGNSPECQHPTSQLSNKIKILIKKLFFKLVEQSKLKNNHHGTEVKWRKECRTKLIFAFSVNHLNYVQVMHSTVV